MSCLPCQIIRTREAKLLEDLRQVPAADPIPQYLRTEITTVYSLTLFNGMRVEENRLTASTSTRAHYKEQT